MKFLIMILICIVCMAPGYILILTMYPQVNIMALLPVFWGGMAFSYYISTL